MRASVLVAGVVALGVTGATPAAAAEIKVLSAGAYKSVVVAIQPEFEKQTMRPAGARGLKNNAWQKRCHDVDTKFA